MDKALNQQILGTVYDIFTCSLKNRFIGYAHISTRQLLTHLFTTYDNIIDNDLRLNDTTMHTLYDSNMPIEVLFNQIKDSMDYAAADNHPNTPK